MLLEWFPQWETLLTGWSPAELDGFEEAAGVVVAEVAGAELFAGKSSTASAFRITSSRSHM